MKEVRQAESSGGSGGVRPMRGGGKGAVQRWRWREISPRAALIITARLADSEEYRHPKFTKGAAERGPPPAAAAVRPATAAARDAQHSSKRACRDVRFRLHTTFTHSSALTIVPSARLSRLQSEMAAAPQTRCAALRPSGTAILAPRRRSEVGSRRGPLFVRASSHCHTITLELRRQDHDFQCSR